MARYARRRSADHQTSAAELRARPHEWQHVHTYRATYGAASVAREIRIGGFGGTYGPPGSFEARTQTVDDGTAVYARYVGEDGIWAHALRSLFVPERRPEDEAT
ncbi:hypothetical protein [Streptomyces sp. NPDC101145]|uniref:hypothetical protein n=1 Tax=Streptomyces sp. NPDC101145 TaxID=3366112 RepID=UPI0037FE82A4